MRYLPPSRLGISLTSGNLRRIEQEYAQELTAHNAEIVANASREMVRLQAAAAETNIRAIGELVARQEQGNLYLSAIQDSISALHNEVTSGLCEVNSNLEQIDTSLVTGFQTVAQLLSTIGRTLTDQSKKLFEVGETFRRRYATDARELRDEAEDWLKEGILTSGDDQRENWSDAIRLFETTLQNPIGHQDYVAYFQLGWLRWNHLIDTEAAAVAFNTARRLSAPKRDIYYLKSLRHLAHMHYLQGQYEHAYETISTAASLSRDHETLSELARYASKTKRSGEALRTLNDCIDIQPKTFELMFAEEDFRALWIPPLQESEPNEIQSLIDLAQGKWKKAQDQAEASIASARAALTKMFAAKRHVRRKLKSLDLPYQYGVGSPYREAIAKFREAKRHLTARIYERLFIANACADQSRDAAAVDYLRSMRFELLWYIKRRMEKRVIDEKTVEEKRIRAAINFEIAEAEQLCNEIGALASEHAPNAFAGAREMLNQAKTRRGAPDLDFAELMSSLAFAKSGHDAIRVAKRVAEERQIDCEAIRIYNETRIANATKKIAVAAIIPFIAVSVGIGILLNDAATRASCGIGIVGIGIVILLILILFFVHDLVPPKRAFPDRL